MEHFTTSLVWKPVLFTKYDFSRVLQRCKQIQYLWTSFVRKDRHLRTLVLFDLVYILWNYPTRLLGSIYTEKLCYMAVGSRIYTLTLWYMIVGPPNFRAASQPRVVKTWNVPTGHRHNQTPSCLPQSKHLTHSHTSRRRRTHSNWLYNQ